jgi:hypothetical protein
MSTRLRRFRTITTKQVEDLLCSSPLKASHISIHWIMTAFMIGIILLWQSATRWIVLKVGKDSSPRTSFLFWSGSGRHKLQQGEHTYHSMDWFCMMSTRLRRFRTITTKQVEDLLCSSPLKASHISIHWIMTAFMLGIILLWQSATRWIVLKVGKDSSPRTSFLFWSGSGRHKLQQGEHTYHSMDWFCMMSTRLRSIDGLNVSVTGGTIMVSTESTIVVQQLPNNKFPMQTYRYQGNTGHPSKFGHHSSFVWLWGGKWMGKTVRIKYIS